MSSTAKTVFITAQLGAGASRWAESGHLQFCGEPLRDFVKNCSTVAAVWILETVRLLCGIDLLAMGQEVLLALDRGLAKMSKP